jgi:lysyl-tRNA synthetase class 2
VLENDHERLLCIKPNLQRRALIYHHTRAFFWEQGFLEIETPIRMPAVAPEQHIVPFKSEDWFLSTSPELHMKRLLASGYDRLFQISRCFRKGEHGRQHNPEFTLLEWYRTSTDYRRMVYDTEQLVLTVADGLGLGHMIRYRDQEIDLTPPWPRITARDAFLRAAGWDPTAEPDLLRFDIDLVTRVIPSFAPDQPTVLLDYPAPMASLARLKPDQPAVAERAEVFVAGMELANAYSELVNAQEQEMRFQLEVEQIEREQRQKMPMPRLFLAAVARLPECAGIALGMDRLVMLFCNADSIDEVVAFPIDAA